MSRGFGTTQPKRRNSKPLSTQREAELEAEIAAFLQQDEQMHPDHYAQAWRAGVYNPLTEIENRARSLTDEETDWLFLAKQVGWLQVQEELNALYFTTPPPTFDPNQADWYLRPDLVTWLEAPMRLEKAVVEHPIPASLLLKVFDRQINQLGWKSKQTEAFVQQTVGKARTALISEDFVAIFLALQQL
ncbi:hypothetical protein IFO70_32490 [Phormidium tenue FACHB-886]|nr:hypothetical protein [Phormidium tenue FACHB-886]